MGRPHPLLHDPDFDQVFEGLKVVAVPGVEGQGVGEGAGGDEEVDGAGTSSLASGGGDGGIDAAVGPGGVGVEGEGIEGGLGAVLKKLGS